MHQFNYWSLQIFGCTASLYANDLDRPHILHISKITTISICSYVLCPSEEVIIRQIIQNNSFTWQKYILGTREKGSIFFFWREIKIKMVIKYVAFQSNSGFLWANNKQSKLSTARLYINGHVDIKPSKQASRLSLKLHLAPPSLPKLRIFPSFPMLIEVPLLRTVVFIKNENWISISLSFYLIFVQQISFL